MSSDHIFRMNTMIVKLSTNLVPKLAVTVANYCVTQFPISSKLFFNKCEFIQAFNFYMFFSKYFEN